MKTTIDIPDAELHDLLANTKARTKREAVVTAIKDYNRHSRMRDLCSLLGTFEQFMTQDELQTMREGL